MSDATLTSTRATSAPVRLFLQVRAWLEAVPYSVLAVPLRLGVAWIFWSSAQVKLINWERTIQFFTDEYRVPILPPEIAASMALAIEITCPILLVLGLFTRFAVIVLMAMTAVIQIFVYPEAWPTHLQWFAMMLVLLCRGAGTLSADHLLWRWLGPKLG
ncbi:MAG: DoxX family protein [Betaproteobacteria bacterium]|nr:DoxX family protein [Betaproteobacteria bacterium]